MLQITESEIIVDMCLVLSKDHAWNVPPVIIQDIIRKYLRPDLKVVFEFNDGDNVLMSGAVSFMKDTQKIFNIPKHKFEVLTINDIDLPFATVKKLKNNFLAVGKHSILPIQNQNFHKKFLVAMGRIDLFRLRLAKHIHTNWQKDSLLSFRPYSDAVKHLFSNVDTALYKEEIEWADKFAPIKLDNLETSVPFGTGDGYAATNLISHYYKDYFIEIIIETDYYQSNWFTEKTVRSLAMGKPFILFSGYKALENLHKKGFKTFHPFINEEYDSINNHFDRFDAILNEVDRLGKMDLQQLYKMGEQMQEILEHNQQALKNVLVKNY